jgi:hypothetical protein
LNVATAYTTAAILLTLAGAASHEPCNNPALIVDRLADGVRYSGCWNVEYSVREAFPASSLLGRLTSTLSTQGWKALDTDPTSPANSADKVHRWLEYDLGDPQKTRVDSWVGWFIRPDQCRLQLSLRYFGRSVADQSPQAITVSVVFVTPEQWQRRPK